MKSPWILHSFAWIVVNDFKLHKQIPYHTSKTSAVSFSDPWEFLEFYIAMSLRALFLFFSARAPSPGPRFMNTADTANTINFVISQVTNREISTCVEALAQVTQICFVCWNRA